MRAEIEYSDASQRSITIDYSNSATSNSGDHSIVWLTVLVPNLHPTSDTLAGTDSNGKFDVTFRTPNLDPIQYAVRGLPTIDSKKPISLHS